MSDISPPHGMTKEIEMYIETLVRKKVDEYLALVWSVAKWAGGGLATIGAVLGLTSSYLSQLDRSTVRQESSATIATLTEIRAEARNQLDHDLEDAGERFKDYEKRLHDLLSAATRREKNALKAVSRAGDQLSTIEEYDYKIREIGNQVVSLASSLQRVKDSVEPEKIKQFEDILQQAKSTVSGTSTMEIVSIEERCRKFDTELAEVVHEVGNVLLEVSRVADVPDESRAKLDRWSKEIRATARGIKAEASRVSESGSESGNASSKSQ